MDITLLRQFPLFHDLPDNEIALLKQSLRLTDYTPGEIVCREGERGDRFYIVVDGELEVVKAFSGGEERLLNICRPGDFFGEVSLFDRLSLRTATIRARDAARLLEMTHADFDALLHRQPDLAYKVMRELAMRLRDTDEAVIRDLGDKNRQLAQAYRELQEAQAQIIEKEKLEQELRFARQIQKSILPTVLPALPGYEFGVNITPAHAVGGDLFDLIPLGKGKLGLLIGDVSDKGIPAAIFMALTRSLFRAAAHPRALPSSVLQRVNRLLLDMNEAGMFVTVIYGILDNRAGEFTYARAGHELPLVVNPAGEVNAPGGGIGQPLGILPAPRLDEQTISLPPGSALLLFTDGAHEVANPQGEFFGRARLAAAARAAMSETAQAVCQQLLADIAHFQASDGQQDDITLMVVKATIV